MLHPRAVTIANAAMINKSLAKESFMVAPTFERAVIVSDTTLEIRAFPSCKSEESRAIAMQEAQAIENRRNVARIKTLQPVEQFTRQELDRLNRAIAGIKEANARKLEQSRVTDPNVWADVAARYGATIKGV